MRWNLRLAAANRGIWQASQLQRMLAERGLIISAGKMSGLWSGHPISIKLADLDVICAVLDCEVGELLIPESAAVPAPGGEQGASAAATTGSGQREDHAQGGVPRVVPRRRDGRSIPPA
jgi:DNA-binding Xre family transcriptional regulator